MKNNNNNISIDPNNKNLEYNYDNFKLDLNNLNQTDILKLKNSLNKIRNLSNILKEKNNLIDGMLLSTKKKKKILMKETSEKENEVIKLENEINIYYNKLFSEYFQGDNNKSILLSKIKFLRRELTQNKYIDYWNKKIMVDQKEEKMQKKLCLLTTEQLEQFNKEIYNDQIFNDKEKENLELMKKQYEDIKKTEIYSKIFNEIKESLYRDKYNNESYNSSFVKSKKKFNSKMLNQSNKGSCASLPTYSQGNYDLRSEMFSNKRKNRAHHSVENKDIINNESLMVNEGLNDLNATQKYLMSNQNYGHKNTMNKKFNSKLFLSNQYV